MRLPADHSKRRRLVALLAAAGVASGAGLAVGAGAGDDEGRDAERAGPTGQTGATAAGAGSETRESTGRRRPSDDEQAGSARRPPAAAPLAGARLDAPSVRRAGRTVVMRFRGTAVPEYVLRALRERRSAGVILFRDNLVSPAQLRAMTAAVQRAAGGRALIMIDQEGGAVRNVRWAAPVAAPASLRTAAAARAAAVATARDLRAHGVNVNLAPVADVSGGPGTVMRTRAFSGGTRQVGRLVAETVRAYDGTGVLPTAKHFPGLGRATVNTDFGQATVAGGGDLGPFDAAVRAGVPLVMSSHALYPALDPTRIASQSPRILRGLLRERLGFDGVVITDSMEAKAVVTRTSTPVAAVRSMLAGNDLLLTTGRGSYIHVVRRLVAEAQRSPAFRARLEEAGGRVAVLQRRLAR